MSGSTRPGAGEDGRRPALWLFLLVPLVLVALFWEAAREPLAAALSLVVGAATIAYAILTNRLVTSTDAMRRAQERAAALAAESIELQIRPNVLVYVRSHKHLLYLMVENAGAGEAFDVRLNVDGNLETAPDQELTVARFIREGFKYLAPRQRHGALLANTTEPFKDVSAEVAVAYRSKGGTSYEGSFPIYLSDFMGVGALDYHLPLERIADSVEKIQTKLGA